MKKIILKSSFLVLTAAFLASCAGHHLCPTYVKNSEKNTLKKSIQLEEVEYASIKK